MKRTKQLAFLSYAFPWLFCTLAVNCLVYGLARVLTAQRVHYSLALPLDSLVPFQSWFVLFYVLAYLQWGVGYLVAAADGKALCVHVCRADMIAKLIAFALFLLLPTTIVRPQLSEGSVFDRLTALIYRLDAPDNLFPSIHCLESWMCFRSALMLKQKPAWYPPAMLLFTLLVFASTVCLRQHVLLDIPGGICAAELGLLISGQLTKRRSFYDRIL